ncbi:MAG TPA: hypothetical protein ENN29_10140 [Candidatus Hydrogenedentes bacterium]|nr:hypothetical protein [Candidatus Hydrogenedentota bacterium]
MNVPALVLLCLACFLPLCAVAQSYPGAPVYGADALGRAMPEASQVKQFRSNRYAGIFYFLWMDLNYAHDVSKILAANPGAEKSNVSPPWGPIHAFHFWGEPLYGYYRSNDPWVLRRHAMLLSDAGVDFLIFDTTNALIYKDAFMTLCEVFDQQRKAGGHVPQISFMVNTAAGQTAQAIYDALYKPGLYPELWFHWKGKPLMLCDPAEASEEVKAFFTLRKAHWPFELVNTHNAWHWEATYPQVYSYDEDPDKPEQVNVSVGQNLHQDDGRVEMMSTGFARGRSFHNKRMDTRPDAWQYGFNFAEQWLRAFELDPEVVFVTGWNEWIAMQLNKEPGGHVIFCDQYNLEFSRDVEMMKGGYNDNYYMQMAANIRRFKGMEPPPSPQPPRAIDMAGGFEQWDGVQPEYHAHPFATLPRDFPGCGEYHYKVTTGRNDFVLLKAAHDAENVYFYAETREPVTTHTDPNWMWLLIDVKDDNKPDWEGFTHIVNRLTPTDSKAYIEVCNGGWNWHEAGSAPWRVDNNRMHIAVPRSVLGIPESGFTLEFKWIDNTQEPGNIMDVFINGDAAPAGRLRYRYEGK